MAYQIIRKNRIIEDLELCRADGTVAETVHVDLNVDQIAGRLQKARKALAQAQDDLRSAPDDEKKVEALGNAVIALFDVIFGVSGREKIVNFYEGAYSEMLVDIFPFISDVIMPKINEASKARLEQLQAATRFNKRGWRR